MNNKTRLTTHAHLKCWRRNIPEALIYRLVYLNRNDNHLSRTLIVSTETIKMVWRTKRNETLPKVALVICVDKNCVVTAYWFDRDDLEDAHYRFNLIVTI